MWSRNETVRCSNSENVLLESMQAKGCETESEEEWSDNKMTIEQAEWLGQASACDLAGMDPEEREALLAAATDEQLIALHAKDSDCDCDGDPDAEEGDFWDCGIAVGMEIEEVLLARGYRREEKTEWVKS
jgi:hypothetical protein